MSITHPSLYLAGTWVAGDGPLLTSYNPADGSVLWQGESASEAQVQAALASARQALPMWSTLPLETRRMHLERYRLQLTQESSQLSHLIATETGKPRWEAESEVQSVLAKFAISYTAYEERCREKCLPLGQTAARLRHKPHGVMAVLGPFNLPAHLPNGHIVPALLAGNTVVFKPSELTPAVAALMAHCWQQADLPAGVFNLLQGGPAVGAQLAAAPDLDGLLFTGSWSTGQRLLAASSRYPSRIVALEMGGNNPLVLWQVKDHIAAAYLTIQSAFITAGQRCSCARRLIIPRGAEGDDFLKILITVAARLRCGPPTDNPEPFLGPLINPEAATHVYDSYQVLLTQGAKPLLPMQRNAAHPAFLSPAIIDVTAITSPSDAEIFGPLLQVVRTATFAEAIDSANQTSYGLAAGIFTDDAALYATFWQSIRAGIVNWNAPLTGASSHAPFGGVGRSGNYRPSAYYAADYSAYPVASMEATQVQMPQNMPAGLI